jgi:hypothetical protein
MESHFALYTEEPVFGQVLSFPMKEPLGIYLVYALCIDGSQTLKNLLENWLFFDSSFLQTSGSLRGLDPT